MGNRARIWSLVILLVFLQSSHASEESDRKMLNLARDRGCMLCHEFRPDRGTVQEIAPPVPSFLAIAKRYKGDKGAEPRLAKTVVEGTGPWPGDRHWAGRVSSEGMMPNTVQVTPEEARALVHWILSLER